MRLRAPAKTQASTDTDAPNTNAVQHTNEQHGLWRQRDLDLNISAATQQLHDLIPLYDKILILSQPQLCHLLKGDG